MKLDIKWKLQQLFEKYNIQKSYLLGHQETKREIIKYAKQMLNKTINDDNFADIAKDLNDYVKNAGSAGYLQFVNEQIKPESVIVGEEDIGDVDTSKLKDGIHYIKDAFVLIEVKDGKLKGQPTYLR